jgi:hypothetical protein
MPTADCVPGVGADSNNIGGMGVNEFMLLCRICQVLDEVRLTAPILSQGLHHSR